MYCQRLLLKVSLKTQQHKQGVARATLGRSVPPPSELCEPQHVIDSQAPPTSLNLLYKSYSGQSCACETWEADTQEHHWSCCWRANTGWSSDRLCPRIYYQLCVFLSAVYMTTSFILQRLKRQCKDCIVSGQQLRWFTMILSGPFLKKSPNPQRRMFLTRCVFTSVDGRIRIECSHITSP